jgi:hypothetical protein
MEARRSTLGVAMLNDHIYAVVKKQNNLKVVTENDKKKTF